MFAKESSNLHILLFLLPLVLFLLCCHFAAVEYIIVGVVLPDFLSFLTDYVFVFFLFSLFCLYSANLYVMEFCWSQWFVSMCFFLFSMSLQHTHQAPHMHAKFLTGLFAIWKFLNTVCLKKMFRYVFGWLFFIFCFICMLWNTQLRLPTF